MDYVFERGRVQKQLHSWILSLSHPHPQRWVERPQRGRWVYWKAKGGIRFLGLFLDRESFMSSCVPDLGQIFKWGFRSPYSQWSHSVNLKLDVHRIQLLCIKVRVSCGSVTSPERFSVSPENSLETERLIDFRLVLHLFLHCKMYAMLRGCTLFNYWTIDQHHESHKLVLRKQTFSLTLIIHFRCQWFSNIEINSDLSLDMTAFYDPQQYFAICTDSYIKNDVSISQIGWSQKMRCAKRTTKVNYLKLWVKVQESKTNNHKSI